MCVDVEGARAGAAGTGVKVLRDEDDGVQELRPPSAQVHEEKGHELLLLVRAVRPFFFFLSVGVSMCSS